MRLAEAAVILLALCASACAVPLTPAYTITKETRAIEFVPGAAPSLRIHFAFVLENSGTSTLNFIEANFPDPREFGRKDLQITLDGREVQAEALPPEYQPDNPLALRIPLDPAWHRGQKRALTIDYVLSSPGGTGASIGIGPDNFHLGSRGWSLVLEPPRHVLAPFPRRPDKMDYTVRVPSSFLLLARGALKQRKNVAGEVEYRFELRKREPPPYVVAGRYLTNGNESGGVVFWTLRPLGQELEPAAKELTSAWETLKTDFGPLDVRGNAPHIVAAPELREHLAGEPGPAAASFPGGALVNPEAIALGIDSAAFLEIAAHGLAHNWFGSEIYPNRFAAIGMGEGLPDYATIVIDEARSGQDARRRRIAEYLHRYDEACKHATEKPLGLTMLSDPIEQRRIALAKAPLFFVALEDSYGEAPVREGLRQLVTIMRGQQAGYNELRSALENTTGKDLAVPFGQWLYQKGIPGDFRKRYEAEN